jgi:hypothetical protein
MQASIKKTQAIEDSLVALILKSSEYRKNWEKAILELRLSITRKVEIFQETTDVFAERSREFKGVMKSARDLCLDA